MLEIYLTGKTTNKRQNFDSYTPTPCVWHSHSLLNGETRRPPMQQDTSIQIAGEDTDHKMS
jgi:hypothetical protein